MKVLILLNFLLGYGLCLSAEENNDAEFNWNANDDFTLFEGDMELSHEQMRSVQEAIHDFENPTNMTKRKGRAPMTARWPKNIVPFAIDDGVFSDEDEAEIRAAIAHWEDNTCVDFKESSPEVLSEVGHNKFLLFTDGVGCSGGVGFDSTKKVKLQKPCRKMGTIVHEIGHVLGFYHEQSRIDRDDYLMVNFDNIKEGYTGNFKQYKLSAAGTFGIPYDYGSIMHYGQYFFAIDGKIPTLVVPPEIEAGTVGQRKELSFWDIKEANLMYSCAAHCDFSSVPCLAPGYLNKDCVCVCHADNPDCDSDVQKGVDPNCVNDHKYCDYWAGIGYCTNENYMSYMKNHCQLACKFCIGLKECKDWGADCDVKAADKEACIANYNANYYDCELSCGLCTVQVAQDTSKLYECPEGHMRCKNGNCVPESLKCNGINNCADNSDENGCPCPNLGDWQCPESGECISQWNICNGVAQCKDGSDEASCCSIGSFKCPADGSCRGVGFRCNGKDNCGDMSMDVGCCNVIDMSKVFLCPSSGICIEKGWVADGYVDCPKGEDEA